MVLRHSDVLKFIGGYPGVFIASVLGNLVPFIPIPYLAFVYLYALRIPGANPILIGIVSGLGGAVGKMVSYLLGRGARALMSKERAERYEKLGKLLRSYGAIAAFLFAVTPSPDDAIVIPLGLMKYDALKLFLGLAAGKIVLSTVTAYAGSIVAMVCNDMLLWEFVVSVVLFVVVMLLLVYVNWDSFLETLAEKGWKGLLNEVGRGRLPLPLRSERGSKSNR
ncbi:MAG: VTT domain-containing protein [Thermofilaceae archaeon]